MTKKQELSLIEHLSIIPDPRIDRTKRHDLIDVLVIAVCAAISGAESWTDIEDFGNSKRDWFDSFLILPHGIPSHDTFRRVFMLLDPVEFNKIFYDWICTMNKELLREDHICIDGKSLRKSHNKSKGISAIHMVNAWSTGASLSLGQLKSEGKKNEIKTIPKLLDMLNIKDTLISIDAMGCQKSIAKKIIEKEGDYLLALKGNNEYLEHRAKEAFALTSKKGKKPFNISNYEEKNEAHGRAETRKITVISSNKGYLEGINVLGHWEDLQSIIEVKAERIIKATGEITENSRYYISSAIKDAQDFAVAIRSHWEIENCLHWRLDVILNEDFCRSRSGHSAENFSTLRHLALNLLKAESSTKSIRRKIKCCGWDESFLIKVLLNDGKVKY